MKTTKKVVKIGNGAGIIIDKPILDKMKIKIGELLELTIKKV